MISIEGGVEGPEGLLIKDFKIPVNQNESQPDQDGSNANLKDIHPSVTIEGLELHKKVIEGLNKAISIIDKIDAKHEIIFELRHQEQMTDKFVKLIRALKSLQVHFYFVLEVLEASEEKIPSILKSYDPITHLYKSVNKKDDFRLFSILEALEYALYFVIGEVEKATDLFIIHNNDGTITINTDLEALDYIQIVTSKLEAVLEYFPYAITIAPDDVFAHSKDSDVWKKLYTDAEIYHFPDKEGLKNQFNKMWKILKVANAILYKMDEDEGKKPNDTLKIALDGFYFSRKSKEADKKSSLYLSNPKMESAFQLWNFPDKQWVGGVMSLKLPTIDYDKRIHIHRLFPSITREGILKEYEEGTLNKILENTFKPVDLLPKKDLVIDSIFTKKSDAVSIRIIAPFPLVIQGISSEKARAMAMKAVNKFSELMSPGKNKSVEEVDEIIIHMHGGGFVSGSSNSHRVYLYRWAKRLNKVIFSVDYRLAPDHPYPAGLDDVWQAYNWIINYAEPILGIKTRKIVVAGDSAGGNLALAITLRAIKMGIRVPDGCFLAYPALSMYPKQFVPSYWLALEDMLLPYSLMKLCIQAYIPEEFKPWMDPFVSPVTASNELLAKLPPVRILTGNSDPLHDINWRFLDKMQKLGKDIKMKVYDSMPHAFLCFDQIDEFKIVLQDSFRMLEELFNNENKEQTN